MQSTCTSDDLGSVHGDWHPKNQLVAGLMMFQWTGAWAKREAFVASMCQRPDTAIRGDA